MQQQVEYTEENTLSYVKEADFPVLVAFSGGKDSIAMVLYLLEQGIDPERIHLHHHDVDGGGPNLFDWPCTRTYCQAFAKALGLSIYFSYRKGGIAREIFRNQEPRQDVYYQREPSGKFFPILSDKTAVNTRLKFPALSANLNTRWCSGTVKIDVLITLVCHHPAYQTRLIVLTGERRAESTARSKYKQLDIYPANSRKRKALHWRPILDWPDFAVWNIMARWSIQPHPAYMLGWSRCSCQACIFNHPDFWATLQVIAPDSIAAIGLIEKEINFTLYSEGPIAERSGRGKALAGLDPFWIDQALNEFTTSIITPIWRLPAGAFRKESAGSV